MVLYIIKGAPFPTETFNVV